VAAGFEPWPGTHVIHESVFIPLSEAHDRTMTSKDGKVKLS